MASEYQLTTNEHIIIRTEDGACIPDDPANRDYAEYLAWVEDGGVPDPYVPPPDAPPMPTGEQQVLFNHENRIRGFEGREPITMADFTKELTSKK